MANHFVDKLISPAVAKLGETYYRSRALEVSDAPLATLHPPQTVSDNYMWSLRAGRWFLLFPYQGPDGKEYEPDYSVMRMLGEPVNWHGEPPPKVLSPLNLKPELHFEPLRPDKCGGHTWLNMPAGVPIVHVESYIKAKSVHKHTGLPCIGYAGVYSWSNAKYGGSVHRKYDFAWDQHPHIILFDSNVNSADKKKAEYIQGARNKLAFHLVGMGCKEVYFVDLPHSDLEEEWGPDDFIATKGGEALIELIESKKSQYTRAPYSYLVDKMNELLVFDMDSYGVIVRDSGSVKKVSDVRNGFMNVKEDIPVGKDGKQIKTIYAVDEWMKSENRRQVFGLRYYYLGEEFPIDERGKEVYNLFKPSAIAPREGNEKTERIIEHLKRMMGDKVELFRSYLRYMRFDSGHPTSFPVLHSSKRGVGKGWTTLLVQRVMGHSNTAMVSPKAFVKDFNAQLSGKRIVVCNEFSGVKGADSNVALRNIKTITGDDWLEIEQKHMPIYTINNQIGMLFTCNAVSDVPSDGTDDRRMWYIDCDGGFEEDEEYWVQLRADLKDDDAIAGVAQWALDGEVVNFGSWRPPATEERLEKLAEGLGTLEHVLLDLLNDMRGHPDKPIAFPSKLIRSILAKRGEIAFADDVPDQRLINAAKSVGWTQTDKKIGPNGWQRKLLLTDPAWKTRETIELNAERERTVKLLGAGDKF